MKNYRHSLYIAKLVFQSLGSIFDKARSYNNGLQKLLMKLFASHMSMTALACYEQGLTFASVHDSDRIYPLLYSQ